MLVVRHEVLVRGRCRLLWWFSYLHGCCRKIDVGGGVECVLIANRGGDEHKQKFRCIRFVKRIRGYWKCDEKRLIREGCLCNFFHFVPLQVKSI